MARTETAEQPKRTPEEAAAKEAGDALESQRAIARNREDTSRETGWFRTEGGVILEYDLPLPPNVAGNLTRVANAGGDPWDERKVKGDDEPVMDARQAALDLADLAKYLAANEADSQQGESDFAAMAACVSNELAGPYAAQVAMRILRTRHAEVADLQRRVEELETAEAAREDVAEAMPTGDTTGTVGLTPEPGSGKQRRRQ